MNKIRASPSLRFPEFHGNWFNYKLAQISEKIQDGTHFSPSVIELGEYKYITSKNIRNGYMVLADLPLISTVDHLSIYKRCDVKFGDVLMTKDGANTGNICLNELHEEISLLSSVAFIRANKDFSLNQFIYQYFTSPNGKREVLNAVSGQAITRITLTKLKGFHLYVPTIPEQKKITDFLSAVDKRIQLLTRKKELLEEYKKGVMQKIFSREIRFNDENGNEFSDWKERKLGEISDVKGGKRIPKGYGLQEENNGLPYITVSDMVDGSIREENIQFVPKEIADQIKNYKITTDDIYVSVAGTLGLVGTIPKSLNNANLTENANKITNFNCHQQYLFYFLSSSAFKKLISTVKTSNAQPKLAIYALKSFKVLLPCDNEQTMISDFLDSIAVKIQATQSQISLTQQFKKGLLQQMFV
jgi:type I restriction enzyme, S subunit